MNADCPKTMQVIFENIPYARKTMNRRLLTTDVFDVVGIRAVVVVDPKGD